MRDTKQLLPDLLLRFNIEHPDLEDCYQYGYEAALAGIEESNNPYSENTKANQFWQEGWWAGFYQEESLFSEDISPNPSLAANDEYCKTGWDQVIYKVIQLTSVLAVPVLIGYQVLDLVA